MAHARVELDPSELPQIVARLAIERARPSIAWLDGDGSEPLGRFSYVGLGTTRALYDWREVERALDAMAPCAVDGEPEIVRRAPRCSIALAYDLSWSMPIGIRRGPTLARAIDAPGAWILEHTVTLAVDHVAREAWLVADDADEIDRIARCITPAQAPDATLGVIESGSRDAHRAAIGRALGEIGDGDLYQVNLARPFTCAFAGSPLGIALAMRDASPVPLGAYFEGPPGSDAALVSRSMERFLAFDRATRALETRPIKGTRPREEGDDEAVRASLLADDKERAEHAMIVDLMRNDLGRLAVPGSVRVRAALRVEPYARLSHLVSIIEARAREDVSLASILEATFPPGSVTGAPKLAAIERIEALEAHPRGFYTGAIGHVGRDGSLALAVSIRIAQLARGCLTYFSGGGIVEASDPERECDETELKARVLFDAARILERD